MRPFSHNHGSRKYSWLEGHIFYFNDCGRKSIVGRFWVVVFHFRGGDVAERDVSYLSVL